MFKEYRFICDILLYWLIYVYNYVILSYIYIFEKKNTHSTVFCLDPLSFDGQELKDQGQKDGGSLQAKLLEQTEPHEGYNLGYHKDMDEGWR